jgi:DNA-binding transcriptional LysR family regulator
VSQVQLSGVEVRHLQALQSVTDLEGSFRVAADRLGYTQGSISAQIGALEKMIGRPLLERAPGRPVTSGRRASSRLVAGPPAARARGVAARRRAGGRPAAAGAAVIDLR